MTPDTTGPTPFAWCRQVGDEVCVEFGDGIVAGRFDLDVASCAAYTAEALNAAVAARERKAATEATACDACDGSGNAASGIRCGCNGQGIHEMLLSVREELTGSVRRERAAAAKALREVRKLHVYGESVFVEYRGPDAWAVTCRGSVLGRTGEWEYEPMPSSRDDDFIKRTRFATIEEAIERARASADAIEGGK